MRAAALYALGLVCVASDAAAAGLDLSMLQTKDLTLVYFDPAETYLTPYVARSFENSLAAQRLNFDWTPWDRTSVWLKDFSDAQTYLDPTFNGEATVHPSSFCARDASRALRFCSPAFAGP